MNIGNDIERLLNKGDAPEQQWVDEVMRRYPYFALPLLLHVKHNGDEQALHRVSIMSPDRRDLSIVVGNAPAAFASFYPVEEPEEADVDNVIDKFLETYAQGSNAKEIAALNKAIFNPTPDYAVFFHPGEGRVECGLLDDVLFVRKASDLLRDLIAV